MSNHQNEEFLERLYDEELHAVEKRWPTLPREQQEGFARWFANKRFEEESE